MAAVWLADRAPEGGIDDLVLQLLTPALPNPRLRQAALEELARPTKTTSIVLEYLNLDAVAEVTAPDLPLVLVAPKAAVKDPWREALLAPGGECPIAIVLSTRDRGRIALVHEAYRALTRSEQAFIRRSASLVARGSSPKAAAARVTAGARGDRRDAAVLMTGLRRHVASALDPSVLLTADGRIRVQVGSVSDTTRNLLREGVSGEQVFILPESVFEGGTNYADIEFLVYLNFFVRRGQRTTIVGTVRQRRALERLLTLVLFGVFDPAADGAGSFEAARATYGVGDKPTHDFLRLAYENFVTRASDDPASRALDLADYIRFIALERDGTAFSLRTQPAEGAAHELGVVWIRPDTGGAFDVRITQPDGTHSAKRLQVTTRRRRLLPVPDEAANAIRFGVDRPRFGVTPLGTSHGFDPAGDVTSFVIWVNGRGILVDPSPEALAYLRQMGVADVDVTFVYLTHIHADHDGGLIEKLLSGGRITVIASDVVFRTFAEKACLITGHDVEGEGLVTHIAANPGGPIDIEIADERIQLETRWNLHPIPTNGFKLGFGGATFGYAADTQYDPALIARLHHTERLTQAQHDALMYFFWTEDGRPLVDLLYHEAGVPPIHTDKQALAQLPEAVRRITRVVHIADRDVPSGFVPPKPALFVTETLLPASAAVRRQALLGALRLVSYLFDVPVSLLEELLTGGEVRQYLKDESIIRSGAVTDPSSLSFYVVVDGEVAVRDGRRLVSVLQRGDSFGEWGISHQRGFRTADVVAGQPAQCMRFGENQYRWLVSRYPVIQERIGTIRRLLPSLQLAQARTRAKARTEPLARTSVVAAMSTSQLSSFALFGTVKTFTEGQCIIEEGGEADGFYILLSGHLVATVEGRKVGELTEGDIFGEAALLDGGRRTATITAISADGEVLFMRAAAFNELLRSVPAFAFEVHKTAAARRQRPPQRTSG